MYIKDLLKTILFLCISLYGNTALAAPTEVSTTFTCTNDAECKRKCEALGSDHRWKPNPSGPTLGTCTRRSGASLLGRRSPSPVTASDVMLTAGSSSDTSNGAATDTAEMISLPDIISSAPNPGVFAPPGLNDNEPCQDPLITAALAASGSSQFIQSCKPGNSWGIIDMADGIYHGAGHTLQCGGLAVGTVAACPGLVGLSLLSCISAVTSGGDSDNTSQLDVCTENEFGDSNCETTEVPSWLIQCGLILPAAEVCTLVAKKFDKECLGEDD